MGVIAGNDDRDFSMHEKVKCRLSSTLQESAMPINTIGVVRECVKT